jgi:hypothetical protein
MGIQEVLIKYDQPEFKGFDEQDLNSELNRLSDLVQSEMTMEELAELMAFGFWEDYQDKQTGWGTYFGPMRVSSNNDGTATESPSIRLVTTDMLEYWLKRANEAQNPILVARYSGLIWDFANYVTKNKPSADIARIYISAVNRIAAEGYFKIDIYTFPKLKRALSIAILLKDNTLIQQCKDTIIAFENQVSADNMPGIWGHAFDLLVFNKKVGLTAQEEKAIIDELEAKLYRLLSVEPSMLIHNIWAAQNAATRLGDYYRKKTAKDEVKRVITTFAKTSELASSNTSISEIAGNAEELYKLYIKYGLKEEASEMLLKVRDSSAKVPAEMKRVGAQIDIPNDKIRQYLDGMTAGGLEAALYKLLITHIPVRETITEQLRLKSSKAPISYLFTQQIVDSKGRVLTTIGPIEEDFEGHLVRETANEFSMQSITLKFLIDEMINKFGLNSDDILNTLKDCPAIDDNRMKIIERGLDAYFAADFVVAIHLIVPQIEEAVRNVVEYAGGNVLKESRGGGFHLRTFDDILRDDIISESLDSELVNYFKILFTDQRGWNLRNNVCHGMKNTEEFNAQTADRLIHALLCLSLIKFVD